MAPALIQRVVGLILATQHHRSDDLETALFLDADLAILGAEARTYRAYARAIRLEYAWLPEALFKTRRAMVIRQFLSRERIYQTAGFARLEQPARNNLQGELATLVRPS